MKAYQKVDGGVLLSCREYDIAANTVVAPGQVVVIAQGLVTPAIAAQEGAILGIAAEAHSGAADALNPRSSGTKILVYDDPDLLCISKAPTGTATGGTATTITIGSLGDFAPEDFTGGYIQLVEKSEDSTNTDTEGVCKRIEAFTISEGTGTFTVAESGIACAGDVYAIFPPVGFCKGTLNETVQSLSFAESAALALKVVGRKGENVVTMAKKHVLAVGE